MSADRRTQRIRALAIAVLVLPAAVLAADTASLRVEQYLADPVGTRDADGRFTGTIAQAQLPAPPAEVLDVQRGAVLVATPSGDVWLDRMDVRLNKTGSVHELCNSLVRAASPDHIVAGTMGAGPGCASVKR